MAVPYTFGSATTSIPLSQLDSNFATTVTLGNTAIQLGNTVTTLNNMTLANVTVSSGNVSVTSVTDSGLTSGRVTYAGTGGVLQDSANLTFNGTTLTTANDASINGLTVGKGGGNGAANTAFGVSALAADTLNSGVTAIGNHAGAAFNTNSDTGQSTFVGYYAGAQVSTGTDNTFVGGSVGTNTTTGAKNTAIGSQALQANTTASNNTAVGYQAGYSNTTGGQNTILGYQAGYSNTTSLYNTFIGAYAGYYATGTGNCFIGAAGTYAAGNAITTGSKNTILGSYSGNNGGLDIRTSSNNIVLSDGDGSIRQYIDSSGKVYIACTSAPSSTVAGVRLGNPNDALCAFSSGTATVETYQLGFYNGNGLVGRISTNGSATTYSTSSDYRLKETIAPMTGALAKVALLKPVTYKWKADGSDGEGFIAHELAEVCPHAVSGEKDAIDADGNPDYQAVDTSFLVATLTAAIQELKTIVDAQAAEIAELKAK